VSRAPNPTGSSPTPAPAATRPSHTAAAWRRWKKISKPSSPVYPVREIVAAEQPSYDPQSVWQAGGAAPPDAGIDAPVVWIREDSEGHELWRGIHEGAVPEVGDELGRSSVDGRPWVVRRIEEANGRTAIHLSKEGASGDPRLVGHHITAGPRVP